MENKRNKRNTRNSSGLKLIDAVKLQNFEEVKKLIEDSKANVNIQNRSK